MGYLDMTRLLEQNKEPFVFVLNKRGTGVLQYYIRHKIKFISGGQRRVTLNVLFRNRIFKHSVND